MNGSTFPELQEDGKAWMLYLLLPISLISSIFGIFGDILMHRNNSKCFYFYIGFIFLYFFNGMILKLWFESFQQIILLFLVLKGYFTWGNKQNEEYNIQKSSTKMLSFYIIISITLTIVFGSLIKFLLKGSNYEDPYPYMDAFIMFSFFIGWYLMSKKDITAYYFYITTTLVTAALYLLFLVNDFNPIGLIYITTNFGYLFLYSIGLTNWNDIYKKTNYELKKAI